MSKEKETIPKDTSGTMLSQKTNEDFNKTKPILSDINPFKSKLELAAERLEAYKCTEEEASNAAEISDKKVGRQRINTFKYLKTL